MNVVRQNLAVNADLAELGLGQDGIVRNHQITLLERRTADDVASQCDRAEHDGVVAQGGKPHVAAGPGAWKLVGFHNRLDDRQDEIAARLDHAATQDDHLRVDQMADCQAGVAEDLAA